MSHEVMTTLVGATLAGGTISALIGWLAGRRKTAAESDSILVDGARALVAPLVARIDDLESRVHHLEDIERKHIAWAQMNDVWPPDPATWDSL